MADGSTAPIITGGGLVATTREEEETEFNFTSSSNSSGAPQAARPSGLVYGTNAVSPADFGAKIFMNRAADGRGHEYFPDANAPGGPINTTIPPGPMTGNPFLPQLPIPTSSPPHIPQYQKIADHVRAGSQERSSNVSRAPALSGAGQEAQRGGSRGGTGWAPSKSQK